MKRKYILVNILIVMLILVFKFTNVANAATAIVSTETLNLREEASTSSKIIELLNEDDELEVISEEENWYKVKHGENVGYVSKDYVKVSGEIATNQVVTTLEEPQDIQKIDENATTIMIKEGTQVRILPLINSPVITNIKEEKEVNIISKTNNWIFVEVENITGWISKVSVDGNKNPSEEQEIQDEPEREEQVTTSQDNQYEETKTKYVSVNSAYVRSEPSTSSDIITTLIKNTDVKVTGESGEWYTIKYGDYSGYIYKELLSDTKIEETNRSGDTITRKIEDTEVDTTKNDLGNEIVEYAKGYLGCSYVYGGSGPNTFDCSGFTMYVYGKFGYNLSHSATAQSNLGTYVSKENLQAGDLVFFSDYQTLEGIEHCGIYIGDGNFIHASSGSGYCVKISTLTSGSYNTRFVTARRLI